MDIVSTLRSLDRDQRNAFIAAFFGWCLDAFDFFILVFVIKNVAHSFHTSKDAVTLALTLTLAMRPVGALIFGLAGDRFGRRGPLIVAVIFYSVVELLTAFSPSLTAFLVLRALFGIGLGGEWGLGASLALESVPADKRGSLSGLLQEGYVVGYLLAALVALLLPTIGWRGMFMVGALPALLSIFILTQVKESPAWQAQAQRTSLADIGRDVRKNAKLFAYMVALMAAFNFMSHGTQDIYPLFLQQQHKFAQPVVSTIAVIYNVGALVGGLFFGSLSQRIGRRRAIVIAALLALPLIPLWAFSHTAVMLAVGAFLMQFMVQGAWGVIPTHLSELAPPLVRGTFIGLAYQCGNLIASVNGPLQTRLAEHRFHGNYGEALALVIVVALLAVAAITAAGRERLGAELGAA